MWHKTTAHLVGTDKIWPDTHTGMQDLESWTYKGSRSVIVMTFWYVFGTDLTFSNFLNFIFTWDWSRPPMFSMFTWLMFIPLSYVLFFTQSHGQEKSSSYYDLFNFGVLLYGCIPTFIFFFHFHNTPTPILPIQILIIRANLKKNMRWPWYIKKRKIPSIWWRTGFRPD